MCADSNQAANYAGPIGAAHSQRAKKSHFITLWSSTPFSYLTCMDSGIGNGFAELLICLEYSAVPLILAFIYLIACWVWQSAQSQSTVRMVSESVKTHFRPFIKLGNTLQSWLVSIMGFSERSRLWGINYKLKSCWNSPSCRSSKRGYAKV